VSHPLPKEDLSQWSAVITPHRGWLDLRLKEVWAVRDLIRLFVQRDFVTTYKQTVLGPLWYFVQPFFTTVVFTLVFGRVGKVTTPGTPQFLFFLAGITAWTYFSTSLTRTSTTFTSNSGLFGKVYFPRLAVPVSIVITNLITLGIQLIFFLSFYVINWCMGQKIEPNWAILLFPLLIVQMAALGFGAGCMISSLTKSYRDLAVAVNFGVQLWMYVSCVVFPLSAIPEKWRWVFILNPMVPIIETFRYGFLGVGSFVWWHLAVSALLSLGVLFAGLVMFTRAERTVMDTA
jgi:lipopolysaccharide transport system permease protein